MLTHDKNRLIMSLTARNISLNIFIFYDYCSRNPEKSQQLIGIRKESLKSEEKGNTKYNHIFM